jgi:hypothetical protein
MSMGKLGRYLSTEYIVYTTSGKNIPLELSLPSFLKKLVVFTSCTSYYPSTEAPLIVVRNQYSHLKLI